MLGLVLAGAPPRARADAAPELLPDTTRIEASAGLAWTVQFRIPDPLPVGIHFDSLRCAIENLDPPWMGGGTREILDLDFLVRSTPAVSAADTGGISVTVPATAEHARLTFTMSIHDGTQKPWRLTSVIEALPGPFTRDHPSRFATANGRKVEYVIVSATREGNGPAILYLPGEGGSARQALAFAQYLSTRGYTTMTVSTPGSGQSDGAPDAAGPATMAALDAALDALGRTPGVDSTRIAIWGVSRGAGAALATAARRASVRAAIGQSGTYDLASLGADHLRCPVLVLHAEDDPRAPAAQAHALADALKAHGATVETHFAPKGGHAMAQREVTGPAFAFLRRAFLP